MGPVFGGNSSAYGLAYARNFAATLADVPAGGIIGDVPNGWTVLAALGAATSVALTLTIPTGSFLLSYRMDPLPGNWPSTSGGPMAVYAGTDAVDLTSSTGGNPGVDSYFSQAWRVSIAGGTGVRVRLVTANGGGTAMSTAIAGGRIMVTISILTAVTV